MRRLCCIRSIAKRLCRSASTISRELKGASDGALYDANSAHALCHAERRASELIESVAAARDENDGSRASINVETQYLLARLLDSGQVSIFDAKSRRIAPSIVASFSSLPGAGGMVAYRLQDTPTEFRTFLLIKPGCIERSAGIHHRFVKNRNNAPAA